MKFVHEPSRNRQTSRYPRPIKPGHFRMISLHLAALSTFLPWDHRPCPTPDLSGRAKPQGLTPIALVKFRESIFNGSGESSFAEPPRYPLGHYLLNALPSTIRGRVDSGQDMMRMALGREGSLTALEKTLLLALLECHGKSP